VVEEDEMLVDVNPLAFHRVARDARGLFTSRCLGGIPYGPLRVGYAGKSE
jgi:hypothetical protein